MNEIQAKIGQLDRLQKQIRWWRTGGVVVVLAVVVSCFLHVRGQAAALVNEGPQRDVFLSELKSGVVRDAVPEIKDLAVKTMDRLGPAMQKEVVKMERRVPELTQRAEAEMELLRQHLPERMERALKPTVGRVIERQVAKWQQDAPGLTADQLGEAALRLGNEANDRIANIAADIMVPLEGTWGKIHDDLAQISKLESGQDPVDSWDLALVSLGLLHSELMQLSPEARRLMINHSSLQEVK